MDLIDLRPATPADIQAVLGLWAVGAENADRPADSASDLERLLARDPGALVVAVDGEEVVGTVVAGWDGWRCHLYRLAVHPGHRRRGIAARLLDHAERMLTEAGGKRSDAMVLDDNSVAATVWARRGYERQPMWSRWVKALQRPTDS